MANERMQRRLERLLDQIDQAEAEGSWGSVRDLAEDVLEIDADQREAIAYLSAAKRRLDASSPSHGDEPQPEPARAVTGGGIDIPTSFANGRYQVKDFLGEGGKKRVYEAHDSVLDRDVAIAVIKTEGLDPTSRVRITREAQAMGRLGDHPHVLSIHDLGEDNGQPYMVLPLIPGGDVGTLLEKAEGHRLPLEQAIDLAAQICRGLEFAHSRSIVHRDLKPGNVWLTSDGTAKIGDFGLAVAIDRSRLTQEGMMVGTVSYMPPEQAMGGDVTPQSDLYSLGAMLYEMVCGRPPFLGDDSVAIIGQHINTPPVAPTWHNSECPRTLEALILCLLTKDPSERPESAADVLTALESIDLTMTAEPSAEHDQAHALDSLAGGVFVGRQREMGELKAALEDALSGRGRLVTLVGEPGIGKTRTAQELATYAALRGAHVLRGRCYEEQGAPPYCPWRQAIHSYVQDSDPGQLLTEMGAGAVDIAEIVPGVREKLPGLQVAPPLRPEHARFRLFESISSLLKNASLRRPLVFLLDNLHWSDEPSLKLLEFLAPELEGSRVLVLATYRDAELARRHPLSRTLAELTKERHFQRVLLRGLGREDVGRYIEVAAGIEPPIGLADAVYKQTEGNALFVTEVVRLLVEDGDLATGDGPVDGRPVRSEETWTIRIPEGVRAAVGRRLDRLSEPCNRTLMASAVVGREFGIDELQSISDGLTNDELQNVLEEALAARVIEAPLGELGRYRFTHSLVQQTLTDELSATQRIRMHARLAEALEDLWGSTASDHFAELAHHFSEGAPITDPQKLVRYSLLAGERALDKYAFEEALGHFQRALVAKEGQPTDGEQAALLFDLGKAQAALLQMPDARSNLTHAFDYFVEVNDVSKAVAVAEYPFGPGNTGVSELVVRALELVPADSHEAGRLMSHRGFFLAMQEGEYEDAQEAFDRALAIAERDSDVALEMWTLARAGRVDHYYLLPQQCIAKDGRAVELNSQVRDPEIEVFARECVVLALMTTGESVKARSESEAMLRAAEGTRFRRLLMAALQANVFGHLIRGEWEAARPLIDRGLALRTARDPSFLAARLFLEYSVGDTERGDSYLERIGRLSRAHPPGAIEGHLAITVADYCAGAEERLEPCKDAASATLASPMARLPIIALEANMTLGLIAARQSDSEEAEKQYDALRPLRTRLAIEEYGFLSIDRTLGLLSVTTGKMDQATAHFEDGLTFCRDAGYRPELAWICCDYADILFGRNAEGDQAKAASLLDESLAISSDLGMRPLMERVLSRKMSLQGIDVSSPETSIDAVVSAVEVERPDLQPHAAPDGTVTIMFTDIEGSTAMTERLGDVRAQDVLRTHNVIIRQQVAAHQGFEVKNQGDGFMVAFSSARRALECAISIQQTLAADNVENRDEPIRVRIGLHTGEAIKEGEDFFGKSVILAARIAAQAQADQILVSSLLKALVQSSGEFEFGDGSEMELKGLAGTHQVFEVNWATI